MTRKLTFLILALFALIAGPGWGQSKGTGDSYELVTSAPTDWSGTYLFAYVNGTSAYVYNGTDSGSNNGVSATISNNAIIFANGMAEIEVASMTGGYSLKVIGGTNNGKYLSGGTSNGTTFNANAVANSLSMNTDGTVKINNNATTSFQFNSASDQQRFRYFKSAQKGVKLYKKQSAPTHTLTFSADNGSITAMNGETVIESGGDVEEGAELDITATANGWYKFSGWSVSETSSTLGSTTENPTTFTMGTADATLTATFAACVVTVSSNDENWGIALYDDESHTISTTAEDGYRISTTEPYTIVPADAATLAAGDGDTFVISGVKDQDVEITINFEAIPSVAYTVFFDGNDHGTPASESITEASAGAGVTLPNCTPNAGYQFAGWATTSDATEADAGVAGEPYFPSTTTTLYAVYNSVYTITWIVNRTPLTEGEQTTSVVEGEGITTLPTTPSDISEMKFQGWTATQIGTPPATAPTDLFTDAEHAPAITDNTIFYAVFAEESEGEATWTKITSVPEAGTYAILTTNYFMKADIISNRFANGSETPAISNDKLTTAPAEDCIWEISKPDTYYRIKNGNNYAGGTNSKNQGALLTDANSDLAKWSISYNNNEFVITNYGRSQASSDSGNKYLRNNGTNGWATYASGTGNAPMLFKKAVTTTYSNYCTTIVEKVLTGISLSGEYPTEFWKGETFSHEGMIVTAHYDDQSTKDVTSSATFTGYDMADASEQTVTVTYEGKTATYNITVKTIVNTPGTAYTVAEAIALIDDGNDLGTEVYVKGTVSAIVTEFSSDYGNITFDVSEDGQTEGQQFRFYRNFKGADNTKWASAAECPAVGDDVIGLGKLTKYNNTYEFTEGNYIVSLIRFATLTIDNITVEIGGTITPVIETNVVGDYTISYTSDNEEVVLADDDEMVTMGLGEATITATLIAEGYKDAETTFTVEVIKALTSIEIETPPTTTSYKVGDFFNPAGLVITANYNDESTEDVTYAENEDKFTFTPSLETPLATENKSVTITYAGKSTTQTISVHALNTYNITWMANGEAVSLTPATVIEGNEIGVLPTPEAEYIPAGFDFAGWSDSESSTSTIGEPYIVNADVILYAVFSREEGGTPGNYEKVTEDLDDWSGEYLIVYEDENEGITTAKVFNGKDEGHDYITATITNDVIASDDGEDGTDSKTVEIASMEGGYSIMIKSGDNAGKYISGTSNSNKLNFNASAQPNSISFEDEGGVKIVSNTSILMFNTASGDNNDRFRYYKSTSTYPYAQLYKKDAGTPGTTHYYTRVYDDNTTIDDALTVQGPSIILRGKTLTVTGTMSNTDPANLVIEDGAQLIQNSEGVMATVLKNIAGYGVENEQTTDGYYLIANPTATNANEEDEYDALDGCTAAFDLYTFDPTKAFEWVNIGSTSQKVTFERSKGYLYANAQDMTLHFRGYLLPTNETTYIDLVYYEGEEGDGREFPGFNLIGNPYTCDAYVNGYNFYTMADGEFILNEGSATIAPCEGFFVEATTTDQRVTLSTGAPEASASTLSLTVNQNRGNVIDRAIVRFDGANDMHKFMLNPAHTNISLAKNGEEFAAVSTNSKSGEMPVNFKAAKNGTYTITVNTENVDAEYLHLIDNKTGMDIDLLASTGSASYTFDAKTSDYASRFKLVFGVNNADSTGSASNFAYMSDGNLVIDNIEGQATLQIIDELGRVISTETVNGSYNKTLNLKAGLYILNLNGMTQKIVVK